MDRCIFVFRRVHNNETNTERNRHGQPDPRLRSGQRSRSYRMFYVLPRAQKPKSKLQRRQTSIH